MWKSYGVELSALLSAQRKADNSTPYGPQKTYGVELSALFSRARKADNSTPYVSGNQNSDLVLQALKFTENRTQN